MPELSYDELADIVRTAAYRLGCWADKKQIPERIRALKHKVVDLQQYIEDVERQLCALDPDFIPSVFMKEEEEQPEEEQPEFPEIT